MFIQRMNSDASLVAIAHLKLADMMNLVKLYVLENILLSIKKIRDNLLCLVEKSTDSTFKIAFYISLLDKAEQF